MEQDIITNTMDQKTDPQARLLAVRMYCQGVKEDFKDIPAVKVWMDNILILAGFEDDTKL